MSFQSYVTERLLAISEALNQINLRAKKIDDLTVQSTLDPSSKIHVSRNGESESLQIQKIIESVQVGTYNRLLSIDTITLSVNVVTIPALAQWVIDNVNYSNPANINITVPYCDTGLSRKDILVANTLNQIVLIQGTETAGITIQPNLPPNTVYVTEMDVTDSSVGQPQPPEVNGAYVQKSERANVILTGSGVINQLDLVDEKATIVFKGSVTRLNTISYASVPYNGKRITLFNAQATPVTIGHSVSGYGVDFVFANGQDYVLAPNETIEFSFDITYAPYAHHRLIGSKGIATWSELQGKPSTFPPSAHTHTVSQITDFPTFKTIENQSIVGAGNIDLNKSDVGLSNVDNTSDANKPVSTATQTALNLKVSLTEKGAANGVATLGSDGKVPNSQIPALAITDTFVVNSQAEQLTLVAEIGDIAIRTDLNKSFILRVTGASTLANWQELLSPTSVDQSIIDGSTNAVSGNAVFDALATKAPISSVHNPVTLGTANGLSLSNQQLSLGLASSGTTGALSDTDWNTFNNKQPAITGLTTNYLPKWNGSGFGNSSIFDNGTNIGIGTTTPTFSKLQIKGDDGNFIGYFYNNSGTAGQVKGVVIEAGTNTSDFALIVNSSQGSPYYKINGNGNSLFGTTTDNLVDRLQVNGTISASPATTPNQVVVKSQLDAVAGTSGSYTPSNQTNATQTVNFIRSYWEKNGNVLTVTTSLTYTVTQMQSASSFSITLPNGFLVSGASNGRIIGSSLLHTQGLFNNNANMRAYETSDSSKINLQANFQAPVSSGTYETTIIYTVLIQ